MTARGTGCFVTSSQMMQHLEHLSLGRGAIRMARLRRRLVFFIFQEVCDIKTVT